jgi:hypothetical protein
LSLHGTCQQIGLVVKTKAKHGFRWGSLRFIGMWVLGYIAAWVVWFVLNLASNGLAPFITINVDFGVAMLAIGTAVLQGIVQKWLVRRGLGRDMRGWLWASLTGGVISAAVLIGIQQIGEVFPRYSYAGLYIFFMGWLVPPALVQAWWIRKRVKNAWLWAGAALANALVFATIPQRGLPSLGGLEYLFIAIVALLMVISSGYVMRYLWTQPQSTPAEKSKDEGQADAFAASEQMAFAEDEPETEAQHWAGSLRRDTSVS